MGDMIQVNLYQYLCAAVRGGGLKFQKVMPFLHGNNLTLRIFFI